nr:MAG TPA: Protein of unknown function (DUF3644) [Caudoviricetes sp.]
MDIASKLLDKSKEAFILGIEIYNRPTIRYRVEGFSFFICNAWELMLKAYMIKTRSASSIYYSDNSDRTLSLSDCIKSVFTNAKDPLRLNLEKIMELRNTSTHFITEEYEMVYIPLFQACVINFTNKMMDFHEIDMTKIIPQNFLTLSATMKALSDSDFSAKYPDAIANRYLELKDSVQTLSAETNEKFAINVNVNHYITKDPKRADGTFRFCHDGEIPVAVLKEVKDPSNVFRYSAKNVILNVASRLNKEGITLLYAGSPAKFNMFHFTNFVKHFGVKENEKLCYAYTVSRYPQYSYSQQAIDFIFDELAKDPEQILDKIKKITPGAKEF